MKFINQTIYKEMRILGLLKEIPIRDERTGKIIGVDKNYRVLNKNKNSNVKTYIIEEPVLNEYLNIIG